MPKIDAPAALDPAAAFAKCNQLILGLITIIERREAAIARAERRRNRFADTESWTAGADIARKAQKQVDALKAQLDIDLADVAFLKACRRALERELAAGH